MVWRRPPGVVSMVTVWALSEQQRKTILQTKPTHGSREPDRAFAFATSIKAIDTRCLIRRDCHDHSWVSTLHDFPVLARPSIGAIALQPDNKVVQSPGRLL
jgi:hypothetical protein